LDLNILKEKPTKKDLPVSPPVPTFTGHMKDPFKYNDDDSMFRLSREIYNGYTKATSDTSVVCTLKKKEKA